MSGIGSLAQFLARLILGIIFIAHGWQKLVTNGMDATKAAFGPEGMDVPYPDLAAYYATWVELVGGIMLILGLLLPIVATLLIADMIGAIVFVHADAGFWNTDGGYEWPLALIAGLLAVGYISNGRAAADSYLVRRRRRDVV
ncbi:DoxX family protein [Gordonia aurantiaca]|uniref:DoxX family protein n=1 Tax=Gordonia sp. B21 TaxID=3151852 RepID=UPI0032653EFF